MSNAPRVRKPLPQWLLEGAFIVVSVVLGFAAAQYGEYRSNRERAVRALQNLQSEIEHNLAVLEPMVPIHLTWLKALEKADAPFPRPRHSIPRAAPHRPGCYG